MSRRTSWLVGAVLALIAGIGSALLVGVGRPAPVADLPSDRVDAAVTSLRESRFHVAPEMKHLLTDEQVAAITDALAVSPEPIHLMYMHRTTDGGYYLEADLLDRVADQLGDGLYIVADEKMDLTERDYGMRFGYISTDDFKMRPADGLLALAKEMAAAEVRDRNPSEFDYWGGPGGGFAAGALMATGISCVLGLIVWLGVAIRNARKQA